jgi:hypothetical protein
MIFRYEIPVPFDSILPKECHDGLIGVAKELVYRLGEPVSVNVVTFWSIALSIWNARQIVDIQRRLEPPPYEGG